MTAVAACSDGGPNAGAGASPGTTASPGGTASPVTPGGTASGSALGLQQEFEQTVRAVLPSVVQISTSQGLGSGIVFDHQGDVVTNAHVVGNATSVKVRTASASKELPARVLGTFTPDDLAVVRVEQNAGALRPAAFGRSSAVRVGEIVLAMGNPLGLTGTVTDGIVSATGRTVSEGQGSSAVLISAVQTSASINPGNSGGALVDLSDRVIGIPTLAASDPQMGGAAAGIGFAIPSDTVTRIAPQLIRSGKVTNSGRAALGITAETVASASGQPAGVGVVRVSPGGGAARAGIKAGDIILAVNGQPTNSVTALTTILAAKKPAQQVRVRYSHDGTTSTVTVTLGALTGS
ncbi:MAG: trypsin-like peptidase domain-containing protein [Actinobacteria bacterium]|nr:trypsin-like peptidase domain-containing protein [Actinomycetota bacterium]